MSTPIRICPRYLLIVLLLILLPFNGFLFSQCTNGSQPECACETAPVLCTIDELDGYTYAMSSFQHPNDGPTPICPGANTTQTNNPTWFAFTAWCTDLTLRVSASNCVQVGGAVGFQLAIYEDCTFQNVVACNADVQSCNTAPKILNITGLNIGAIYYFMVDGCLGSYCTVTIDVIGVCGQEVIAPWTSPVFGNVNPCVGDSETYAVEDLDGARIYHWFLDGVPVGQSGNNSLNISWPVAGTYELCIDASNDPCVPITNPPLQLCTTINVHESEAGVLEVMPTLLCLTETATISSSGFTANPENSQVLLITDASGLIIDIINASSGSFTSSIGGTYTIYAYNYITSTGVIPLIGNHISLINCSSGCCDLEGQTITYQSISASVSNILCDDNGTGHTPADDVFYFDLLVTGQNAGTSWRSTDGTLEGMYGIALHCGPYLISTGGVQFDLHDFDVPTCWTSISVNAPASCSVCNQSIDAGLSGILDCMNTELTLNGTSSEAGSYLWMGPNQFSANSLSVSVSDSGWYYLHCFFANQCSFLDSVFIDMDRDTPVANAGADLNIDCKQTEVLIDGSLSTGNHLQYEWINNNGEILTTQNMLFVNTADTYVLFLTNTLNGCTDTDTVEVNIHPNVSGLLTVSVTPENCDGDNDGMITVNGIEGGTPPYSYFLNGMLADPGGQFIHLSPGGYHIEISDAYGCTFDTSLTVDPGIHLELNLPEFIELVEGETGFIHPTINIPAEDLISIQWTPPGLLSCDTCLITNFTTGSDQILQLTIVHINGCVANGTLNINVVQKPKIFIPNTFSPNSDGNNDFFSLYSNDRVSSILELNIFDRWGELIYQGKNLNPNDASGGWDGKFKGKEMSAGTFVYSFKLLMTNETVVTKSGDITLLR